MENTGDVKSLKDIGDILKTQRVARGLSLEEVQGATKIRHHHLVAMEAGDFDLLPGEVYARGFLRTYADYIGLDGGKIVEQYRAIRGRMLPSDKAANETERAPGQGSASKASAGKEPGRAARSPRSRISSHRISNVVPVGVTIIVVIAGIIIYIVASKPPREQDLPQTSPRATAVVSSKPQPAESAELGQASRPHQDQEPQLNLGSEFRPDEPRRQDGQPKQETPPAQPPQPATEAASEKVKHESEKVKHELSVTITQRCWVRVVADGRVVFERIMDPGDSRTWTARERLKIKAGNTAGIVLIYNGKKLEISGRPGQVKEWTFPPGEV
ncbi:MAG TPA: helix-turn-helix domain-containing protein [Firmicutes bacterium]|nr:helix-turn-helix domain-containing protein [Bacillota bacterium]